jgi:hypothetical protein
MRRRDLKAICLPALARDKVVMLAWLGMTFAIMLVVMSAQLQKADAATAEHLGILRVGSDEFLITTIQVKKTAAKTSTGQSTCCSITIPPLIR